MSTHNKKLSYVDFIRFIAALCVVFIHSFREIFGFTNIYLAEYLGRWPVGFFFLVTGFFLKDSLKDFVKYIFRIFILYFIWTILYALILGINIWNPWDLFLNLRGGIIMPFWYFPSLLLCLVWVWLLKRIFRSSKTVCIISGILFIVALLGSEFNNIPAVNSIMDTYFFPVFERIQGVHTTRDGIFNGSFFISIGLMLRSLHNKKGLVVKSKIKLFIALIIAIALYITEITLVINYSIGLLDVLITSPFVCALVFILGMQYKLDAKASVLFRNISSCVFIIHYFFLNLIQRYIPNQWIWFFGTSILSVIFALTLIKLSRKIKILEYIY